MFGQNANKNSNIIWIVEYDRLNSRYTFKQVYWEFITVLRINIK